MKFLKVLTNSFICGIFFSLLLLLLVLDLNINLDINLSFMLQLLVFFFITYGLVVALFSIVWFFIVQFFSGRKLNIAFVSPAFMIISWSILIVLFLILFRANIALFSSFFDAGTQQLLSIQTGALLFLAVLGLFSSIGYIRYKKRIAFALVYFILAAGALFYTFYQRTLFPGPPAYEKIAQLAAKGIDKKVTIIGLEGLSFDFIVPLTAEGKLPNFSWLMEEGSWGKLESFTPNEALILNRSFNTGKYPYKHRCVSDHEYFIFNSQQGIQTTPRYIFFRQLTLIKLLQARYKEPSVSSKDIWDIFAANKRVYLKEDDPHRNFSQDITPEAETIFSRFFKDLRFETSEVFDIVKRAFCADVEFDTAVSRKKEELQPQFLYLLLPGLNIAETFFYKYSFPDLFGEFDQEEIEKYNSVIERYYQYYDEIIGRYAASKMDDELLVVYASHGVEPLPLLKRYLERLLGNSEASAYHEYGPDGLVFFVGKDITGGNYIEGMKLVDLAPTFLHYLGLPVGKDMDGIVNSSIFSGEFKTEPVLFISTYEEHDIKNPH